MNNILVRHKWEPYVWLLPSILLMAIFVVFPIAIVFRIAFSEVSRAGIIGGYADGSLRPMAPATRAQTVKILLTAMDAFGI